MKFYIFAPLFSEAEKNFEILGEQFKTNVCKCIQGSETDIREYEENLKQFYTSMKTNIGNTNFSFEYDFL